MLRLAKYLKPYWWLIVLLLVFVFGQTYTTLALPDYTAKIIDEGIVGLDRNAIYSNGLRMLLISLIGGAFMVGVGYLAARIATGVVMNIRDDLFTKVERFSLQEFNQFSTASLITRCTNDMQQIQTVLVMLLRVALMAPIMGVWAIAKAYGLAPSMTWIMAVAVGTIVLIIGVLFAFAMPRYKRLQNLVDRLNLVTREILTGLRVIHAFNKEAVDEHKFEDINAELTSVNLFVNRLLSVLQPTMLLVFNLTSVVIVWGGASQVDRGNLAIGNMLAYMQYAMQTIFAFLMISIIFIMVPRAAVSANRVVEVLQTPITITDPVTPVIEQAEHPGHLVFDNVSFAYPVADVPVLQDISFEASPGEFTAIVGSTGSGKTTLVNLIPRFYDVTAGRILIDGVDVRDFRLDDLYAKLGYVPQKSTLFSGTVASNIRYGAPDSTDAEMRQSAAVAQADFINQLEDQFDAHIAQAGTNLSGGQKQRVSIARAIVMDPEIYIFDDSFSALDFKTESRLRGALRDVTRESTVIVVAQRVSTIMHADNILVLDKGRLVCQGTHEELLRDCPVYQEIASSQLSDEELGMSLPMPAIDRERHQS
ncbi:MAG: ABC transporter ATP-binding protein [Thermomicrobiales bacterium]